MRKLILTVSVLILLTGNVLAQPSYKIGYITDLSGKAAFWGTQSTFGAEIAAEELRASNIPVEIIVEDCRMETGKAISAAQKITSVDKVDAVMSDFTPPSVSSSAVVARAKKLFVYLSPVTSILSSNNYAFKSFLDYRQGCKEIAMLWRSNGISKAAKLKLNAEFGELCLDGAREVYPDLHVIDYNSGEDLRSHIISMKHQGIQGIFQTAYEVDMLHRLKVMEELNYKTPVGGPEPLLTDLVIQSHKRNLEDVTVFGFPAISPDFLEKVAKRDPNRTHTGIEAAALAYTHVHQIGRVLAACEKGDADCHVARMKRESSDSSIGFGGWKDRIAVFDYSLKIWRNGALEDSSKVGDFRHITKSAS
ncbi:ABC transporter substrate-binding protein [bacterium]|nr:ABC transporter substrate-binding protein [bacterium]